ncbi:AAA family ATPase [Parasutterella muris]|uniref:AAA family ATPase n=1 Tax=uncultured Parasutterella sp. TaxID=1263098 RepID=UPI0030B9FEF7
MSYTTRREKLFKNFIEINLVEDSAGNRLVGKVKTTQDFYLTLASLAGTSFGTRDDTLIFLDEIQQYPELLTLLKFLRKEGRFRYVASGSLLGITLKKSTSIPLGSIEIVRMYQLDFEEFLIANSINSTVIEYLRECLITERSPISSIHERLLDLFKKYLLVGGMPDAVHEFLESQNIVKIRDIQNAIHELYELDAGKYDEEHRLKIKRIYEMIPSNMENKKKRLFFNAIEGKKARASNFLEEIDYLTNSGISLEVQSNTDPTFPLIQSSRKIS